ncbi:MAG: hypothetical protein MZV64_35960 [Ignavibacteriales bacterium]|nr:hypothetical protein [Ignavibacteriales bacterium]
MAELFQFYSAAIVKFAAKAAIAPNATHTGNKTAPTTPKVNANFQRGLPCSFFTTRTAGITFMNDLFYLSDKLFAFYTEFFVMSFAVSHFCFSLIWFIYL